MVSTMRSTTCLSERLALGRAERAAEVLLSEDVRGVERPGGGHLDVELLEGDRAVAEVRDARVAAIPDDLVVGVTVVGGEESTKSNSESLRCDGHFSLFSLRIPTLRARIRRQESEKSRLVVLGPPATRCSGCTTTRRKMLCYYSTVITPCQLLLRRLFHNSASQCTTRTQSLPRNLTSLTPMELVLALDAGTTGVRTVAFGPRARGRRRDLPRAHPVLPLPGEVEHDPREIADLAVATLREVASAAQRDGHRGRGAGRHQPA